MKRASLVSLLIATVLISCSQTNASIKRGYAFYTVNIPGMIMKGEDGRDIEPKLNLDRYLYIECGGIKMPVIESISYDNKPMKYELTRVEGTTVSAGKTQLNSSDYTITTKKGNTLWKIDLAASDENVLINKGCKNIIIKTRMGKKLTKFYLYKEIEIMGLPRY